MAKKEEKSSTRPLNKKVKTFVDEFMIDKNGQKAAERAGYKAQYARKTASRLMGDPRVIAAITAKAEKIGKTIELNATEILREAARIGFSDVRALFDEHMLLKPVSEWPEDLAHAVASIEVTQTGPLTQVTKVKLWSKVTAIDMLMKHRGLYEKDNEQKNPLTDLAREDLRAVEELANELIAARANAGDDAGTARSTRH